MLVPLKDMAGKQIGEIELDDSVFAAPVNTGMMHQALVRQLANARLGTHKTKSRGEVSGGGRKPWRQKGTGRARQGSIRAPNWVGGGTVFGPRPRSYIKKMPRKMRHAALRSALSAKAGAEQIVVVDALSMEAPRTKAMIEMLRALEVGDGSVLLVTGQPDVAVQLSARNLRAVKTLLPAYLNIRDLLGYDTLLLSRDAVEQIEAWLGNGQEEEAEAVPASPEAAADRADERHSGGQDEPAGAVEE